MPKIPTDEVKVIARWGETEWGSNEVNISEDILAYNVKYGLNLNRNSEYPSFGSARGRLVLNNREGKYTPGTDFPSFKRTIIAFGTDYDDGSYWEGEIDIPSPGGSIPPTPLDPKVVQTTRPHANLVSLGVNYVMWEGYAVNPQIVNDTIVFQLEGKSKQHVETEQEFAYLISSLENIYDNLRTRIGDNPRNRPVNIPDLGIPDVNARAIRVRSTLGGFINALAHWSGSYLYETHLGQLGIMDATNVILRRWSSGSIRLPVIVDNMAVHEHEGDNPVYLSMDITPLEGQIKNIVNTAVAYTIPDTPANALQHTIENVNLPTGFTLSFSYDVPFNNIVGMTWKPFTRSDILASNDSPANLPSSVTVSVTQTALSWTVTITNRSGRNYNGLKIPIFGTPTRVFSGRTIRLSDTASRAAYGDREIELAHWWELDNSTIRRLGLWGGKSRYIHNSMTLEMFIGAPEGHYTEDIRNVNLQIDNQLITQTIQPGYALAVEVTDAEGNEYNNFALVMGAELSFQLGSLPKRKLYLMDDQGMRLT